MSSLKKVLKTATLFIVTGVILIVQVPVFAQTQGRVPTAPTFPTCETKIAGGRGDWSHSDSGQHDVPKTGPVEGREDTYNITQGSFVQCICATGAQTGTQSNFWNIDGLPLGQVDIDAYVRAGWLNESTGTPYGLLDAPFLIKQRQYSCIGRAAPTSRPTPTLAGSNTGTGGTTNDTTSGNDSGSGTLPKTGVSVSVFFALVVLGEVGYIMYQRFKLV